MEKRTFYLASAATNNAIWDILIRTTDSLEEAKNAIDMYKIDEEIFYGQNSNIIGYGILPFEIDLDAPVDDGETVRDIIDGLDASKALDAIHDNELSHLLIELSPWIIEVDEDDYPPIN